MGLIFLDLQHAIQRGHFQLVKRLKLKGGGILRLNPFSRTTLWIAIGALQPDIVDYLIPNRGMDLNAVDWKGRTTSHRAAGK